MNSSDNGRFRYNHDPSLNFDEVFFYGTSTRNIKIESWWSQLTKGATVEWKVGSYLNLIILVDKS